MSEGQKIILDLAGPVNLTGPRGMNLTPAGMKARGILAYLGTCRQMRSSRVRLQDKLWSTTEPAHGAASLRQALSEIRRHLGPHRDALQSGSGWVGLDPDQIAVSLEAFDEDGRMISCEFAEDLDIKDAEFEDWLRDYRQHHHARKKVAELPRSLDTAGTQSNAPIFVISKANSGHLDLDAACERVLRSGTTQAAEFLSALVFDEAQFVGDYPTALKIFCSASSIGDLMTLQVGVSHMASGRQIWSRTIDISVSDTSAQLQRLAGELTLALLNYEFGIPDESGDGAHCISLRDIFAFTPERLFRADRSLGAESDARSRATRLALRAFVRNTIFVERLSDDGEELLREAQHFCREAFELEPQNSVVLAVGSIIASRTEQYELAFDLAHQAINANSANPLSRYSLSYGLTGVGDHERAFKEAEFAQTSPITAISPATWLMRSSVSAVRANRLDEALRYAATAHGYSPDYRPALRFMSALYFEKGDEAATARSLEKLRELEPDFSLKLMASDSYPVTSLRATGLLQVTASGLI